MTTLNGYHLQDNVIYKVMQVKELLRKHILSKEAMAPNEMFFIRNVTIPMYREKMNTFHTLGSISFSNPSPSILIRSLETIFNALYKLKVCIPFLSQSKMQAKNILHFEIPSDPLDSRQQKRCADRSSYCSTGESMTTSDDQVYWFWLCVRCRDMVQYRNELQLALETLSYLSAFKASVMENVVVM